MELDNENNSTVFLRESDPFMPILPSPESPEEFLEEGLKTPPINTYTLSPCISQGG